MGLTRRKERLDRGIKVRSDDVFLVANYRDLAYVLVPRILPVVLLLILPLVLPEYWVHTVILVSIYALLALSWDFMHSAGMISLGHSLLFGVGGYFAASLNHYFGFPIWLTIPLGTVGGALVCTLLLVPVLRLRGIYFGMVTFALSMIGARLIEATHILGGTEGLSGLDPLPNIWVESYLPLVVLLIILFGIRRLIDSNYGMVLRGINESDLAVEGAGIDVYWYKAQILFIGSLIASFAGAFMVHYTQIVGMSSFALDYSLLPVACVICGGTGSFAGAVLGAFLLVPFSEFMRAFGVWRIVFYCVILAVFIVSKPEGIFHAIQRWYQQFQRFVKLEVK